MTRPPRSRGGTRQRRDSQVSCGDENYTLSPFKRLVLRAVLNDVSPIVARVFSITDDVAITDLHDIFLGMLDWQQDLGFLIRVHG